MLMVLLLPHPRFVELPLLLPPLFRLALPFCLLQLHGFPLRPYLTNTSFQLRPFFLLLLRELFSFSLGL